MTNSQKIEPFEWTCPFCDQVSTVTERNYHKASTVLKIDNVDGPQEAILRFVVCPNPKCKRFTLDVSLYKAKLFLEILGADTLIKCWNLIPASRAKRFPPYVPKVILDDYYEACSISDLSPKASATLSRRCLQGMIRDFWGVKKPRLVDEIDNIKDKVDRLTWEAIDAVRGIGNIGAHMEKDMNLIVDVEPEEATQLIGLIEILIKDWYIRRHEHEAMKKGVVKLKDTKEAQKKGDGQARKGAADEIL